MNKIFVTLLIWGLSHLTFASELGDFKEGLQNPKKEYDNSKPSFNNGNRSSDYSIFSLIFEDLTLQLFKPFIAPIIPAAIPYMFFDDLSPSPSVKSVIKDDEFRLATSYMFDSSIQGYNFSSRLKRELIYLDLNYTDLGDLDTELSILKFKVGLDFGPKGRLVPRAFLGVLQFGRIYPNINSFIIGSELEYFFDTKSSMLYFLSFFSSSSNNASYLNFEYWVRRKLTDSLLLKMGGEHYAAGNAGSDLSYFGIGLEYSK